MVSAIKSRVLERFRSFSKAFDRAKERRSKQPHQNPDLTESQGSFGIISLRRRRRWIARDPLPSTLQKLPVELLLLIVGYLDDTSKICLKYTSHYFRTTIFADTRRMSRCTRWLIMTRFEEDMFKLPSTNRVACACCKKARKLEDFDGGSKERVKKIIGKPGYVPLQRRFHPRNSFENSCLVELLSSILTACRDILSIVFAHTILCT